MYKVMKMGTPIGESMMLFRAGQIARDADVAVRVIDISDVTQRVMGDVTKAAEAALRSYEQSRACKRDDDDDDICPGDCQGAGCGSTGYLRGCTYAYP